jgi:hypothetical protein
MVRIPLPLLSSAFQDRTGLAKYTGIYITTLDCIKIEIPDRFMCRSFPEVKRAA